MIEINYYIIGDVRTNEQPGLTAIHALWVREHNRIINRLAQTFAFPENNPEEREVLYQSARRIVIAEYQVTRCSFLFSTIRFFFSHMLKLVGKMISTFYLLYFQLSISSRSSYTNSTWDPSWTITFTHCSNLERDNATMNHRHSLLIHQMNGVLQTGTHGCCFPLLLFILLYMSSIWVLTFVMSVMLLLACIWNTFAV